MARGKVVDTGLQAAQKAVTLKPDYFEAMAYYNLLFREKAKLELDPVKAQEWIAKAEEWTQEGHCRARRRRRRAKPRRRRSAARAREASPCSRTR